MGFRTSAISLVWFTISEIYAWRSRAWFATPVYRNDSGRLMDAILDHLSAIARRAGDAIAALPRAQLDARLKAPHELVTAADHLSHAIFEEELGRRFPGLPCVLEEHDEQTRRAGIPQGAFIVGDELDGTVQYARGTADWGVTLAYIDSDGAAPSTPGAQCDTAPVSGHDQASGRQSGRRYRPRYGVIYLPVRKLLIVAGRGQGCWLNGTRLRLQPSASLRAAVFATEMNPRLGLALRNLNWALMDASLTTRCVASSTASAAELLLGHTDVYLNGGGGRIWDFAAAALAIEEAGGAVCAADGQMLNWQALQHDVLFAASPHLLAQAAHAAGIAVQPSSYD